MDIEYFIESMVFTHEIVVSEVKGVNAANEWDVWYKATIVYIPYGLTTRDILGWLYSIHVHKESKFPFYNN